MLEKFATISKQKKLIIYLLMSFAFLLPFAHFIVIVMVMLILVSILEVKITRINLKAKEKRLTCTIVFFFLLHLIGLTYTQNTYAGWFDVKTKVVFLLFAFVFITKPFSFSAIKMSMYAFITGLFCASASCLANATYIHITEQRNAFFYQDFAIFLHPAYFALYLNFAIGWMFIRLTNKSFAIAKIESRLLSASIVVFSGIIILLSSKLGLITLFLIYLSCCFYYIFSRKKYAFGIGTLTALIVVTILTVQLPYVKARINNAIEAMERENTTFRSSSESTAVRLWIWQAANKIISNHFWLGVGTGDTKDVLMETYLEENITGAYNHNLNAHNQFYQEFIALGLIGFMALVLLLVIPLINGIIDYNLPLIVLTSLLVINFLTESMLETQAGVTFTAFFISLLGFTNSSDKQPIPNNLQQ